MPGTLSNRRFDLVICDIDGCLSSEASLPFDLDQLAIIAAHNRRAVAAGDRAVLTVCSGRPQPFAEAMSRLLQNTLMPCVCENGAWVYHPGTNVYTLDPAITPGNLEAVGELSRWARREFGPGGTTQQPGKTASVTLYHPDTAYLKSLMPRLVEECTLRKWPFRISMTWLYINCDLLHVNKGTGLDRMLKECRLDRARLAGIGDTTSDSYIAERVAFFACPSNAQAAIKEHAHYISPHAETRGVIDILTQLE